MTTQLNNKTSEFNPLQNVHPAIDLARAMRRLAGLKEKAGDKTKFNRKELVSSLDFGTTSGAANAVISALMYFGFLRRVDTDYFYTDLGTKLLTWKTDSKEYAESLDEALRNPELYRWLKEKYEQLPEEIEDILIGKYHDRGVKKENVKNVLNNYLKSVTFVDSSVSGQKEEQRELDEYVSVSFRGNTVPIYARHLIEAIRKTREDELIRINESLRQSSETAS